MMTAYNTDIRYAHTFDVLDVWGKFTAGLAAGLVAVILAVNASSIAIMSVVAMSLYFTGAFLRRTANRDFRSPMRHELGNIPNGSDMLRKDQFPQKVERGINGSYIAATTVAASLLMVVTVSTLLFT